MAALDGRVHTRGKLMGNRRRALFPADDPAQRAQRQPDIALARDKLGWQPTVALEDGLTRTIAYFDGLLSEAR